ncbi:hypothetical protein F4678DRAFT_452312 [Xylaria arbuscula]|nr:hypothetical protein F4678DRAFT_452312 [Xylaria arbuscula]
MADNQREVPPISRDKIPIKKRLIEVETISPVPHITIRGIPRKHLSTQPLVAAEPPPNSQAVRHAGHEAVHFSAQGWQPNLPPDLGSRPPFSKGYSRSSLESLNNLAWTSIAPRPVGSKVHTTISKDNTADENWRRSSSFAYLGSKLKRQRPHTRSATIHGNTTAPALLSPQPQVIRGPTIERKVIPHYRDINHGIQKHSQQDYLKKRETERLALLRKQVAEKTAELQSGVRLSKREKAEFAKNREILRLAEKRLQIDDHRNMRTDPMQVRESLMRFQQMKQKGVAQTDPEFIKTSQFLANVQQEQQLRGQLEYQKNKQPPDKMRTPFNLSRKIYIS